ncbi:MAG: hypothetical protein KME08_01815 [Aphanothece sp. CMT-3BRIN-NPC111]|nr:hypothetical protein [Aphanothece sp. CMT-3BRIN-NPC111]
MAEGLNILDDVKFGSSLVSFFGRGQPILDARIDPDHKGRERLRAAKDLRA